MWSEWLACLVFLLCSCCPCIVSITRNVIASLTQISSYMIVPRVFTVFSVCMCVSALQLTYTLACRLNVHSRVFLQHYFSAIEKFMRSA